MFLFSKNSNKSDIFVIFNRKLKNDNSACYNISSTLRLLKFSVSAFYICTSLYITYQASGIDLLTSLRVDTRPCLQPDIRTIMGQVPKGINI